MSALSEGTRLGPYVVAARIGAGGMGEVYRATDTRLNRPVAIKVLPASLAEDPEFRARFRREAQSIAALSHPNVCVVHDVGHESSHDFLVMELLDGETLAERLRRGRLPLADVLEHGIAIARALGAAHRRGVVHRDLKPGNVMLTSTGVKVLDFGLAKSRSELPPAVEASLTQSSPVTLRGMVLGTPGYIPPEQLLGKDADRRSDIFALGAVLFEMATGERAFAGDSQATVVAAVLERDPTPKLDGGLPPLLRRIIARCLAKDPDQRWQDASDVAEALRWVADADGTPSAARPRTIVPWVAAGIATLAAISALVLLARGSQATPDRLLRLSIVPPAGTNFVPRDITGTPHFALSPDGSAIVFVAAAPGGTPRLWLRPLHLPEARMLAGTEDASGPFWSPDSTQVAFFARRRLKKLSIAGGNVQDLAEISFDVTGGTWSPSGTILFAGPTADGLYRIPSSGGRMERATSLGEGDSGHRWPQFLPDGRSYLFYIRSSRPNGSGVYVMPAGSDNPRMLIESRASAVFVDPGYLLFERNGALMAQRFDVSKLELAGEPVALDDKVIGQIGPSHLALTASSLGTLAYWTGTGPLSRIEWRDRRGTLLSQVGSADRYFGFELSPDGTRLLSLRRPEPFTMDLVSIDLATGIVLPLTFSPTARFGIWSPEGERVIFSTVEPTGARLLQKPASGAGRESVLLDVSNYWGFFALEMSRDGRWLVCAVTAPTAWDLWAIHLPDGGRRPVVQTPSNEVMGQLSPDSRWLAYASDRSGSWEVYVTGFPDPAAGVWQVSTGGGSQPRWRADGTELFYVASSGALTAVPVQTTPAFKPGAPRRLFDVNIMATLTPFRHSYDVSADGQRFILGTVVDQAIEPIMLVENWRAALSGR